MFFSTTFLFVATAVRSGVAYFIVTLVIAVLPRSGVVGFLLENVDETLRCTIDDCTC